MKVQLVGQSPVVWWEIEVMLDVWTAGAVVSSSLA
jgi:hypothetical protein